MSSNNLDSFFMSEAIKEAKQSLSSGDWPVGCVIVLDGQIIARGNNRVYSENNKIMHAEINAINKVSHILSNRGHECTMYITYEPCPMCLGAILLNHIGKVVCGVDIDESGSMKMIDHLPKRFSESKYTFELVNGFMEDECREIFVKGVPVRKLLLNLQKNKDR